MQPGIAADGTLTYQSAVNASGSATVTARLHDNGGTANGGVDMSAPQTFTIEVVGTPQLLDQLIAALDAIDSHRIDNELRRLTRALDGNRIHAACADIAAIERSVSRQSQLTPAEKAALQIILDNLQAVLGCRERDKH